MDDNWATTGMGQWLANDEFFYLTLRKRSPDDICWEIWMLFEDADKSKEPEGLWASIVENYDETWPQVKEALLSINWEQVKEYLED